MMRVHSFQANNSASAFRQAHPDIQAHRLICPGVLKNLTFRLLNRLLTQEAEISLLNGIAELGKIITEHRVQRLYSRV